MVRRLSRVRRFKDRPLPTLHRMGPPIHRRAARRYRPSPGGRLGILAWDGGRINLSHRARGLTSGKQRRQVGAHFF